MATIQSLESLCVKNVAKNLGKGKWHQSYVEDEGDPSNWLSPFDVLPPFVLASVIDAVKTIKGATRQKDHLELLITKNLEELDLKSFPGLSEDAAFHLLCSAALTHSPLKVLKFSFKKIPYHKLQKILPVFPNLQVLDVGHTSSINDSFMPLVASSCPQLKSFLPMGCDGVTDVGMQRFCTSPGGGICNSLVSLNIRGTRVTQHGARLALEHLTKLQTFQWGLAVQVIVEMYQSGERRPLALTRLEFDGEPRDVDFEENSLATAIKLCPFLVYVSIEQNYEASSQDLRALLDLDNLQRLILRCARRVSFDEDLLPVLRKFGHKSLEFLCVSDIKELNLGAIVEHCSMLRWFYAYEVGRFTPSRRPPLKPNSRQHLPRLEHLHIQATGMDGDHCRVPISGQPSAADLALLLTSAPAFIDLELEMLDNLKDEVFEQAIIQHGFPKLNRLEVLACPNVTRNVVDLFLELDNPPSLINIEKFQHLHDSPHDESKVADNEDPIWKVKVERNNLNVDIHYCECDPL